MSTYTRGLTLKTTKIITKSDIITLCNILNECDEYKDLCTFEPERIAEGGIIFKFKEEQGYKSVRLCTSSDESRGKWDIINKDVMSNWRNNTDLVFPENNKFSTTLKEL